MKSKFVRTILGDNYQLLSGWKAVNLINERLKQKTVGLTAEQERVLKESFGDSGIRGNLDMPFLAYAWDEKAPQGKNVWWRLTIPFLLIWVFVILALIVLPIKWVFTGKYQLGKWNKLGIITENWYNKVFKRKWCN